MTGVPQREDNEDLSISITLKTTKLKKKGDFVRADEEVWPKQINGIDEALEIYCVMVNWLTV